VTPGFHGVETGIMVVRYILCDHLNNKLAEREAISLHNKTYIYPILKKLKAIIIDCIPSCIPPNPSAGT
jgi:hypothetical protein